jgi:hypothetical protein
MDLVHSSPASGHHDRPRADPDGPPDEFEYTPLGRGTNEVRLLTLKAGDCKEDIKCLLTPYKLDQNLGFEALSYSWGTSTETIPISINACHSMHITTNLHSALRHLRCQNEDRILWIDAVCINQKDDTEKNHQVRMMKQIYESADQVVIWLGEAIEHTGRAFEKLKEAAEYMRESSPEVTTKSPQWTKDELFGTEAWTVLIDLFRREWWTRIWVIQEVALAKQAIIACGNHYLSADCYSEAMLLISATFILWNETDDLDLRHSKRGLPKKTTNNLLQLAQQYRGLNATNPRDKLYGLLGLAEDMGFEPEYQLSVRGVYGRFVEACIKSSATLDVLSFVSPTFRNTHSLPSWIPDWTRVFGNNTLIDYRSLDKDRLFRASGDSVAEFQTLFSLKQAGHVSLSTGIDDFNGFEFCSVSGFITDTIAHLGDPAMDIESIESLDMPLIQQWIAIFETSTDINGPYKTDDDLFNALWMTLVADYDYFTRKRTNQNLKSHRPVFERWLHLEHREIPEPPPPITAENNTVKYMVMLKRATESRRFFVSTKGYVGLAPFHAEVGDLICVLFGGQTPFILRNSSHTHPKIQYIFGGEGNAYLFIGECYVQGIMDGEAYEEFKRGDSDAKLETFVLA